MLLNNIRHFCLHGVSYACNPPVIQVLIPGQLMKTTHCAVVDQAPVRDQQSNNGVTNWT